MSAGVGKLSHHSVVDNEAAHQIPHWSEKRYNFHVQQLLIFIYYYENRKLHVQTH